ncbi:neprilysin-1 [Trichonephila clavata]|uniref:Neprilysin-1 n=1 Tax=Trichonephila clavata TaxID=2740835 RepID=A0A8X6LB13_TRICU|nr:neprilysin-1 [Trichonephila clavata]
MLPFLDGEYSQKRTEFKKVLLGISAERERWSQCVDLVNKKMGMAVGALFIRDNFDPKSKETAQEMILNIREAFNELLEENAWMDKETREVAREKANAMNERIGYPDLLTNPVELSKEYEGLTIHDDLFLVNILNVFEFEAAKNLKKLRQPVNKDRWTTEPAVVNAFYNPNKNDIVFPAGILQPLFYSHYFPKSLNYGGIGVVIGHEMTHGFDDKGRQFDKDGNLKQWWNEATVRRFRERAQCIIDQYSSYVLEDIGLNINGKNDTRRTKSGLSVMGRTIITWTQSYSRSIVFPQLCTDLVWLHEAGRCIEQSEIFSS